MKKNKYVYNNNEKIIKNIESEYSDGFLVKTVENKYNDNGNIIESIDSEYNSDGTLIKKKISDGNRF